MKEHLTRVAGERSAWIERRNYYYAQINKALQFIVEPQRRVLSVRCGAGNVLQAVQPARGVGIDVSEEMVVTAKRQNAEFEFRVAEEGELNIDEKFDYVIVESINETVDVLEVLRGLHRVCERQTRIVIYTYSQLWAPILRFAEWIGLKMSTPEQNWLSEHDLRNLLSLADFEWIKTYRLVLFPFHIPFVSAFFNSFLARMPLLSRLTMVRLVVCRPSMKPRDEREVSVSVVIPCRNERDNIEPAVRRIPDLGRSTEIIFCDDKSTDGTREEVLRVHAAWPHRNIRLVDGPGINKAQNVWTGFDAATGDILIILDGDLAVMPEELPPFVSALARGKGELINGVRMVYPVPRESMKTLNKVGNRLFSSLFSVILGQRVDDTLCGTKVIWRSDWPRLRALLSSWGVRDRWGDFELLFSASRLGLRIVDLPVHYQERVFGTTKMVRVFHNGIHMLKLTLFAFFRLRFGF